MGGSNEKIQTSFNLDELDCVKEVFNYISRLNDGFKI